MSQNYNNSSVSAAICFHAGFLLGLFFTPKTKATSSSETKGYF
jgi:hypothetical protein